MPKLCGVVTVRTERTFQLVSRDEVRQVEITEAGAVRWWILDGNEPYEMRFFNEEGEVSYDIAERFFADVIDAGYTGSDVYWERLEVGDDEGDEWKRNGEQVNG
jgi:hypothetical protein